MISWIFSEVIDKRSSIKFMREVLLEAQFKFVSTKETISIFIVVSDWAPYKRCPVVALFHDFNKFFLVHLTKTLELDVFCFLVSFLLDSYQIINSLDLPCESCRYKVFNVHKTLIDVFGIVFNILIYFIGLEDVLHLTSRKALTSEVFKRVTQISEQNFVVLFYDFRSE